MEFFRGNTRRKPTQMLAGGRVGGKGRAEGSAVRQTLLPPRGLSWQAHRQDLSHWEEVALLTA